MQKLNVQDILILCLDLKNVQAQHLHQQQLVKILSQEDHPLHHLLILLIHPPTVLVPLLLLLEIDLIE